MALSFPSNPGIGEQYTGSNGVTYVWNGSYWAAVNSGGGGSGGTGGGGGAGIIAINGTTITYTATILNFIGPFVYGTTTASIANIAFTGTATASSLGLVQVGPTLTIDSNGTLNAKTGNLVYWSETGSQYNTATNSISYFSAVSGLPNADAGLIPKGTGAHVGTTSGNERGQYATDWQKINIPTSVASGNYSVIGGGSLNQASGLLSTVIGGSKNVADAPYSTVLGGQGGATNGITGAVIIPGFATGGIHTAPGGVQGGVYIFGGQTSDNSYHTLTTDGSLSPTAANQLTLKDNSAVHFRGMVVAKQFQTYRGDVYSWTFEGTIRRDVGSTTTDFVPSAVAPVVSVQTNSTASGWGVVLDINNSLGTLEIQVKGNTGEQVRWSARLDTIEVFDAV